MIRISRAGVCLPTASAPFPPDRDAACPRYAGFCRLTRAGDGTRFGVGDSTNLLLQEPDVGQQKFVSVITPAFPSQASIDRDAARFTFSHADFFRDFI
jgi:hypothetical protein